MRTSNLTGVVIGAGWAGKGHTKALQQCGVDVAAICARTIDVVESVAQELGVPLASADWRQTLATVKPDIVTLATPATLRAEVIETAAGLGCHILSDKPLATDAVEARRLFEVVDRAGIKHAYAATHRYAPFVTWVSELIRDGAVGVLHEVDVVMRAALGSTLSPWSWFSVLASGGGILNNRLPHILGSLERIMGGPWLHVMGEARHWDHQAPVIPEVHDLRQVYGKILKPAEAAGLERRECDSDYAFSALFQFASPTPGEPEVRVSIAKNYTLAGPAGSNGWTFYGSKGSLVGKGRFPPPQLQLETPGSEPRILPIPQRLLDAFPNVSDGTQGRWVALAQDFVADILGRSRGPYLTFYDGWRYQEAIDAIRSGRSWFTLPS